MLGGWCPYYLGLCGWDIPPETTVFTVSAVLGTLLCSKLKAKCIWHHKSEDSEAVCAMGLVSQSMVIQKCLRMLLVQWSMALAGSVWLCILCCSACWLWQTVLRNLTTVGLNWLIPVSLSSLLDGLYSSCNLHSLTDVFINASKS